MLINQLESIAQSLYESLPESVRVLEKDLQSQFKDVLQAAFAKMDLVTRDEFDVQTKVLARTRQKLETLELQVEQLNAGNSDKTQS